MEASDEAKPEPSTAKTVEFMMGYALVCALTGIAAVVLLIGLIAAIDVRSFNALQVVGVVCVSQGVGLVMLGFAGRRFVRSKSESTASLLELPPKAKKQ